MSKHSAAILLLALVSGTLLSCSDEATCPEPTTPSYEARLMALCLSGQLHPPASLASDIEDDLFAIRETFRDACPFVDSVSFEPPWIPSQIMIGVTDSTAAAMLAGGYHSWDSLNQTYGLVEKREYLDWQSKWVVFIFADLLHPRQLIPLYENLPGILYVTPNGLLGSPPNIYPRYSGLQASYLFSRGHGFGCPRDCQSFEYWYFQVAADGPHLVGSWDGDPDTQPSWWSEARLNLEGYSEW